MTKSSSVHFQSLVSVAVIALTIAFEPNLSGGHANPDDQWLESKNAHYSIFYQAGYEKDAEFTRNWMDRAETLMKTKYRITPDRYYMSVYLLPAPAGDIDTGQSGQNQCCSRSAAGLNTGTIKLLTISAPIWKDSNLKSSLGLSKNSEDYHAKVLMSEYIPVAHYAAQSSRPLGGWRYYSAPNWFVQGLQEYDAIFHTTETNRTMTSRRLFAWAKNNPAKFSCCSPGLEITEPYNGGAAFMAFLAAKFGEDIHGRLLRNPANSFAEALASETKPYSSLELFELFQRWLDELKTQQ